MCSVRNCSEYARGDGGMINLVSVLLIMLFLYPDCISIWKIIRLDLEKHHED